MSSNQKIVLYTLTPFGVALVIYSIAFFYNQPPGLKAIAIGTFTGFLLNLLFWPKSFVNSIGFDKTQLRLNLKNQILKKEEKVYSFDELSLLEFKKKVFFVRDFNELRFLHKGSHLKFKLIGKKAEERAKALVKSVHESHSRPQEDGFHSHSLPPGKREAMNLKK